MTLNEGICYPMATLVRFGISEANLRQAVIDGDLDRYSPAIDRGGFSYDGGQILSAIERGVLKPGPPGEPRPKRPSRAVLPSLLRTGRAGDGWCAPITTVAAVSSKEKPVAAVQQPKPSLQSRYRTIPDYSWPVSVRHRLSTGVRGQAISGKELSAEKNSVFWA